MLKLNDPDRPNEPGGAFDSHTCTGNAHIHLTGPGAGAGLRRSRHTRVDFLIIGNVLNGGQPNQLPQTSNPLIWRGGQMPPAAARDFK